MSQTEKLLKQHQFRFSHSLGQNFITDEAILENIVDNAGLPENAQVLEIGAGAGTLTCTLAKRCRKVVALEIDSNLLPILRVVLHGHDNVTLLHADIMKTDLTALWQEAFGGEPFYVVANLPYYITTPVLMMLLEPALPIEGITVMVQKEVALRIAALPGGKEYGALSVAVQYRMAAQVAFEVPAAMFNPPPKVDSAVVVLKRLTQPPVAPKSEQMFFRVVKSAFAMRRKTMSNNLCAAFSLSKQDAQTLLEAAGIPAGARGETLSMAQMALLADLILEKQG